MYDVRLLTLVKLVSIKNYTKTAKELNFTQPTVTQHIKSLEKDYNINIFNKDLSLTNAGKMLLEYAKQEINNHDLFLSNINNLIQLEERINLGMNLDIYYSLSETGFFYDLIKTSKNRIAIAAMSFNEMVDSLMAGRIDFGFANIKTDNSNLLVEPIYQDEIVLSVKKDHLLLNKHNTSLKKYFLVTLAPNDPYYSCLDKFFSDNNIYENSFKNILETNNFDISLKMVLEHNAVGVFYKNNISSLLKKNQLVIYKQTDINIPIYLIRNKINYDPDKLLLINNLLEKIRD